MYNFLIIVFNDIQNIPFESFYVWNYFMCEFHSLAQKMFEIEITFREKYPKVISYKFKTA